MKSQQKEKGTTVFDVFVRFSDANYPELLMKFLEARDVPEHEKGRAEYLLDQWAVDYQQMGNMDKSNYAKVIPKLFKKLLTAYLNHRNIEKTICILYGIFYDKWSELTKYLKV